MTGISTSAQALAGKIAGKLNTHLAERYAQEIGSLPRGLAEPAAKVFDSMGKARVPSPLASGKDWPLDPNTGLPSNMWSGEDYLHGFAQKWVEDRRGRYGSYIDSNGLKRVDRSGQALSPETDIFKGTGVPKAHDALHGYQGNYSPDEPIEELNDYAEALWNYYSAYGHVPAFDQTMQSIRESVDETFNKGTQWLNQPINEFFHGVNDKVVRGGFLDTYGAQLDFLKQAHAGFTQKIELAAKLNGGALPKATDSKVLAINLPAPYPFQYSIPHTSSSR
jgi:hypothetical protein